MNHVKSVRATSGHIYICGLTHDLQGIPIPRISSEPAPPLPTHGKRCPYCWESWMPDHALEPPRLTGIMGVLGCQDCSAAALAYSQYIPAMTVMGS